MARVLLENVSKSFKGPKGEPIWAVDQMQLDVTSGELLVLVGPSGCGKTTTLRLIAGLEEVTRGRIWIEGRLMNEVPAKDRDIAMVFQNYALYPHLTVYDNLGFGLKIRRHSRGEIDMRVRESADTLGLAAHLNRYPNELSSGERQRVALGRALVRNPKVFLFDEPLANLDVRMRLQMRREIAKLHKRLGATMVYVTHDQAEAMSIGDRIALMKAGRLQQVADPLSLYSRPVNLFAAGFIGFTPMNFFHGWIRRREATLHFVLKERSSGTSSAVGGFQLDVEGPWERRLIRFEDQPIVLGLRPEDIDQVIPGDTGAPTVPLPENAMQATVDLVEPLGSETYLHLLRNGQPFTVRVSTHNAFRPRQTVWVVWDLKKAHFFDSDTEQTLV